MAAEQKIQNAIINWLTFNGCYVVKIVAASKTGIPDLLCCCNGVFVGIECKAPGGTPDPLQAWNGQKICVAGGYWIAADSLEKVKNYFAEMDLIP